MNFANALTTMACEVRSRFIKCAKLIVFFSTAILVLYMTIKLGYSDDAATVLFHVFTALVYLFPILGAIVADSFLGKFR
jgi:solute carrier family 15 (oligopeptide transporter), member 1